MSANMMATPPGMVAALSTVNPDVKWALETVSANAPGYAVPRSYYKGEQPLAFAGQKFREAFGKFFHAFAENNFPRIIATVKDRLIIDGFQSVGAGASKTLDAALVEIWRRNRMRVRAKQVHQDGLIDGDAFVIVWPHPSDEKQAVIYPNRASLMAIVYHDEEPGYIVKAAKVWVGDDKKLRLNLFYPDRIEKFITTQKLEGSGPPKPESFVPFESDGEAWPLLNPYGKVPVFHFGNRASIGEMGVSDLAEAIPLTDALNKTNADLVVAEEFYAVPQRWATGMEEFDPKKIMPGGVWSLEASDGRFGQFDASDIKQFVETGDMWRRSIARVTRTPDHHFSGGDVPSGESLKMLEAPLVAKVIDAQDSWGMVWGDVMRLCAQIEGAENPPEVETIWRDTTPRNEKEAVEIAIQKSDLGVSEEQNLRELGYTAEDIANMREQRRTQDIIPDVGL